MIDVNKLFIATALAFYCMQAGAVGRDENMLSGQDYEDLVRSAEMERVQSTPGSIFSDDKIVNIYADSSARMVGDIITVILTERTNANMSASTSTSKDNSLEIDDHTLLGNSLSTTIPRSLPFGGMGLSLESLGESTRSFDGDAGSSQSNNLSGSISVVVVDRLPNGYLKVEGKKTININQGDEQLYIEGIVRTKDIRSDNTILSTNIANAKISYSGKGVLHETNKKGWLSRIVNSKWWPF